MFWGFLSKWQVLALGTGIEMRIAETKTLVQNRKKYKWFNQKNSKKFKNMSNNLQKTTNFPLSLFDDFWRRDWLQPFSSGFSSQMTMPAVNVKETADQFLVEFAVPGKKKEDFKISVENNMLTVSSEEKVESESEDKVEEGSYTRREFRYSSFSRSFTLPKSADADKISAKYEDGVLNVFVPKKEAEKVPTQRLIEIG